MKKFICSLLALLFLPHIPTSSLCVYISICSSQSSVNTSISLFNNNIYRCKNANIEDIIGLFYDAIFKYSVIIDNDDAYFYVRFPHKSLDEVFKPHRDVSTILTKLSEAAKHVLDNAISNSVNQIKSLRFIINHYFLTSGCFTGLKAKFASLLCLSKANTIFTTFSLLKEAT